MILQWAAAVEAAESMPQPYAGKTVLRDRDFERMRIAVNHGLAPLLGVK